MYIVQGRDRLQYSVKAREIFLYSAQGRYRKTVYRLYAGYCIVYRLDTNYRTVHRLETG